MAISTQVCLGVVVLVIMVNGFENVNLEANCKNGNSSCSVSYDTHGNIKLNCSGRGLNKVPTSFPRRTISLDLSNNNLSNIGSHVFNAVSLLHHLNLARNVINEIDMNGFRGLHMLQTLDVSGNKLQLDAETFRRGIFKDLSALHTLKIHKNSNVVGSNLSYPGEAVGDLYALKTLWIDGIRDASFSSGFKALHALETLVISGLTGNCDIRNVTIQTFQNLCCLKFLQLTNCNILHIQPYTFQHMIYLESLDLSDNDYLGFDEACAAFQGLDKTGIRNLKVNHIHRYYDVGIELKKAHVLFIQNTNITSLSIDRNRIEMIEYGTISLLPRSLKHISAKANTFTFGLFWFEFAVLTNLLSLDVSFMFQRQPFVPKASWNREQYDNTLPFYNSTSYSKNYGIKFTIPPNLQWFDISHCRVLTYFSNITFRKNNVKVMNVSHNLFNTWTSSIIGLDHLELLDLSDNYCSEVSENFFSGERSLQTLVANNNLLGFVLEQENRRSIFQPLSRLQELHLHNNRITHLGKNVFQGLVSLRSLDLSSNWIQSLQLNLDHISNLSKLDLSQNQIQTLSSKIRDDLDNVATRSSLWINLARNPLRCNCDSLEFLKWILRTKVILADRKNYRCELHNGTIGLMSNLTYIVRGLEKECMSYITLIMVLGLAITAVVGVVIGGIIYRYRWKLRYLYYSSRRRHRRHLALDRETDNKQFDMFVSYADQDRNFVTIEMRNKLEIERGLRLCIHERDFLPGKGIAESIMDAIQNSRKTVFVLSSAFLESKWCKYEFMMARLDSIYNDRNIMFVIMYENIQHEELFRSIEMRDVITSNSYIEYPHDEEGNEIFWKKCERAVKDDA